MKLWIIEMVKYNIVVCCYGKMLVNVAVYVITGARVHTRAHVCACVCVCVLVTAINNTKTNHAKRDLNYE